METLTIDDALSFGPCWEDARERMENIATAYNQQEWSAVDILRLPEDVASNEDKLWLVLREELIDAPILHEFACRCAEHALSRIDNPDPRSVAAIEDKRAWLSGDITDDQLQSAQDAAYYAVEAASCDAAYWAAYWAADDAAYLYDAKHAAYWAAYWAAADAVDNFADDDGVIERAWQVDTL
ncbi:MAG: hypothetical protein WCS17_13010, partial [Prevotella sp.]